MTSSYFTTARWIEMLRGLPPEAALLQQSSYELLTGLRDKTIRQACWRLGRQQILTHVGGGWYTHAFRPATIDEAAAVLVCPSYISLETVLKRRGIVTQPSVDLTCVTLKPTDTRKTPLGVIAYRSISRDLFFGFETKRTANRLWVFEAHPEKALLDLIYLNGRTGSGIWMDFDFGRLDPVRLAEYVSRFPKWVAPALAKLRTTHTIVS